MQPSLARKVALALGIPLWTLTAAWLCRAGLPGSISAGIAFYACLVVALACARFPKSVRELLYAATVACIGTALFSLHRNDYARLAFAALVTVHVCLLMRRIRDRIAPTSWPQAAVLTAIVGVIWGLAAQVPHGPPSFRLVFETCSITMIVPGLAFIATALIIAPWESRTKFPGE